MLSCCGVQNVIILIMQNEKLSEDGNSNINNIPLNVIELTKMYAKRGGALGIAF